MAVCCKPSLKKIWASWCCTWQWKIYSYWWVLLNEINTSFISWFYTQEDITVVPNILIHWYTICKATNGAQLVSFPQSATFMPSLWFLERQWTTVSDGCNALWFLNISFQNFIMQYTLIGRKSIFGVRAKREALKITALSVLMLSLHNIFELKKR